MDQHVAGCHWCQATLRAASGLRFRKLGKHERRLLLAAAYHDAEPVPILPPGPSHDDRTSTGRAKRKLVNAGLIVVAPHKVRVTMADNPKLLRGLGKKYAVLELMSRTALGDEIVKRYKRELETPSARLRWLAEPLESARDSALANCPHRD